MATRKAQDLVAVYGKPAAELAQAAHNAWKQDVWQVLGIKDATATKMADSKGEGGTRAMMLQVLAYGFADVNLATRAVAYGRQAWYGNTVGGFGGITFSHFDKPAELAKVAPNATLKIDAKGVKRMVVKPRGPAATTRKPKVAPSADSRNSEVRIVKPADNAKVSEVSA